MVSEKTKGHPHNIRRHITFENTKARCHISLKKCSERYEHLFHCSLKSSWAKVQHLIGQKERAVGSINYSFVTKEWSTSNWKMVQPLIYQEKGAVGSIKYSVANKGFDVELGNGSIFNWSREGGRGKLGALIAVMLPTKGLTSISAYYDI